MVQEEVAAHNAEISKRAFELLEPFAPHHLTLSPESERSILEEAILVKRAFEDHLKGALRTIREMFGEKILWALNGPLPPYHFSNGHFELVTKDALFQAREILKLSEHFSMSELKEAYHAKALETHPDQKSAEHMVDGDFTKVEAAYRLLRRVFPLTQNAVDGQDFFLLFEGETREGRAA
jgi:hypothetical protein